MDPFPPPVVALSEQTIPSISSSERQAPQLVSTETPTGPRISLV